MGKGEAMKKQMPLMLVLSMFLAFSAVLQPAQAEGRSEEKKTGDADLAQELSNPIADLITVPIQMNFDRDISLQDDGWKLPVSLQAGVGYWVESPDTGPEGFRFRFQANFVLPKFF